MTIDHSLYCQHCTKSLDNAMLAPVRVVEVKRTDNYYIVVCATCAIDLCDKTNTHRRIAQQSSDAPASK